MKIDVKRNQASDHAMMQQEETASKNVEIGSLSPLRRFWASRWSRLVIYPLCFLLAIVGVLMWMETSFIFLPGSPRGDWNPRIRMEVVDFRTPDGLRLHGWYLPHKNPRAYILFCHGNAGNITHRAEVLKILHDRVGAAVFIFDYRGYGRSQGKPDESGVLVDARAARDWLAKREGIDPREIVLLGRSLGGGVAVDLAAKDGAKGLILESTFTSVPDIANYYYPWLPARLLMRTRFDSLSKIGDYHGPLLQSHSEADETVPIEFGRRLFEAANEPKQFIRLSDVDHNDPLPPSYYEEMIRFLDSLK